MPDVNLMWAGTGVPQQPAPGQDPPYIGDDNIFTKIPPRTNSSAEPASLRYNYSLPYDHLPGIHWSAPHSSRNPLMSKPKALNSMTVYNNAVGTCAGIGNQLCNIQKCLKF
jgi:hypothetical protein